MSAFVLSRLAIRDSNLKFCKVDGPAEMSLASAMQRFSLSALAYSRILKLSRTIADLDGAEHVTEAIQYRSLDRNLWA